MTCCFSQSMPTNVERFLNESRNYPILSTITGITETSVTAVSLAGVLPITAILKAASILPLPSSLKGRVTAFYDDAFTLSQTLLDRLNRAIISSVPFVGGYLCNEFEQTRQLLKDSVRHEMMRVQFLNGLDKREKQLFIKKAELLKTVTELTYVCEKLGVAKDRINTISRELSQAKEQVSEMQESEKAHQTALDAERKKVKALGEEILQGKIFEDILEKKLLFISQSSEKQAKELQTTQETSSARSAECEEKKKALRTVQKKIAQAKRTLLAETAQRTPALSVVHTKKNQESDRTITALTEQISSLKKQVAKKDKVLIALEPLRRTLSPVERYHP